MSRQIPAFTSLIVFCATILMIGGCSFAEDPPSARSTNPMGISQHRDAEAQSLFARARVLWHQPKRWEGTSEEKCSDPQKAVELLSQVINREPNYAPAYIYRGLAKSDLADDSAFDDITHAIQLDPSASHYTARASVSLADGNAKAAQKDAEHALSLDDSYGLAWEKLSIAYRQLDSPEEMCCTAAHKACSYGYCASHEALIREGLCSQ